MFCGFAGIVDISLSKKIKLWILLMQFGAKTGCHQLHERSFSFKGYQFPVCARCTGLFIGQIMGLVFFIFLMHYDIKIIFLLTFFSFLGLGLDGILQLKNICISNNYRRLITGFLCGFFVICFDIKLISLIIVKCSGT
jgi:uncharacterized membrane protein